MGLPPAQSLPKRYFSSPNHLVTSNYILSIFNLKLEVCGIYREKEQFFLHIRVSNKLEGDSLFKVLLLR